MKSLYCVLEQDTLFAAKWWFNTVRAASTSLKNCCLGCKEPIKQTNYVMENVVFAVIIQGAGMLR